MIISINEKICEENNLHLSEVLAILLVKSCKDIPELFNTMEEKKIIKKDMFEGYMVTQRWDDVASSIVLDSDKEKQTPERLEKLASDLMKIFPKEKKAGTCHYFRGNKKDILLRLKKFFKLYGKYSDEQILNAATNYVSSFNGDYSYMRILKYFIWKDEVKRNAEGERYVDEVSDLANWIENEGSDTSSNRDWNVTVK